MSLPDYDAWLEAPYTDAEPADPGEAPFDDRCAAEIQADEDERLADLYKDGYYDEFPTQAFVEIWADGDSYLEGDERLEDEYDAA